MKKKLLSILGPCLLIVLLAGCSPKPEDVALQLAEAVNTQDLEGALALFADDAVVTSVSPEPFNGKAEIRGWLEEMFADNFHVEAEIVAVNDNVVIERDTMTMDSMIFYGIETLTGTSEVTVEDGKIKTINISFSDETLADLQAAPFVAPEDLIGVWTVGTTSLQFKEDGTVRAADKIADLDMPVSEEYPGSIQKWMYDGMVFTIQGNSPGIGEGYTGCTEDVGIYFVKWSGNDLDRLRFTVIEDTCANRLMGMQWGNWVPVSP